MIDNKDSEIVLGDEETSQTTSEETSIKPANKKTKKIISDIIFYSVCTLIVLFTIFTSFFWVSTVKVQQNSMLPTLKPNDIVILDKLSSYSRGDVIVFSYSENDDYIKRVIGIGGDTVWTENGDVYLEYTDKNGKKVTEKLKEDYINEQSSTFTNGYMGDLEKITIPEGKLFVLGDNRHVSVDSRHAKVGLISQDSVKGVVKEFWISAKPVTTAIFGLFDKIFNLGK